MNYDQRQELQFSLFSQPHGVLEVSIAQQQSLLTMMHECQLQRKWVYLLAEHIQLNDCPQYCIAMQKPSEALAMCWIEKIIQAGQTAMIIVENLQLDEVSKKRLALLCQEQGVTIVNITKQPMNNLIYGPW